MTRQLLNSLTYNGEKFWICTNFSFYFSVDTFSIFGEPIPNFYKIFHIPYGESVGILSAELTNSLLSLSSKDLQRFFDLLRRDPNWHRRPTCCYTGYQCNLVYDDDQLYLQQLNTFLKTDTCPEINGVHPQHQEFSQSLFPTAYKNLRVPINWRYKTVIMKDPLESCWYTPADFKTVIFLLFNNGKIEKEINYSKAIQEYRSKGKG